jgi:putative ABC transport system permease protein
MPHPIQLFTALFRRKQAENETDAELRAYLDLLIAENIRAGMPPQAARREALLHLGGIEQVKEQCRDVRPLHWLGGLWQDVHYAFRTLRKSPGFTAVALASLALGIGANSAIFGVFYDVLMRPLPYAKDAQLLCVGRDMDGTSLFVASPEFSAWRANIRDLEGIAAWDSDDYNMTGAGVPELVHAGLVSASFLAVLGVRPAIGRDFTAADARPGAPGVALLTDAAWKRYFGGSLGVIGRPISLNDRAYAVSGILPRSFRFPGNDDVELLVPFGGSGFAWTDRGFMMTQVIARARPGVTARGAAAELQSITDRDRPNIPSFFQSALLRAQPVVMPLRERLTGQRRPALLALFGAVGLLLLIACVNVANLQLARASVRQREIGLRAALGASRMRLARWLIVENLALSAMAGMLGLAVSYALLALMRATPGVSLAGPGDLRPGWILWGAAFLLSALTGLAAGLAPALFGPQLDLNDVLKSGALPVAGGRGTRVRSALVVTQVALALALLVGAGLLLRSLERVLAVGYGFRAENLLTAQMRLPQSRYPSVAKRDQFIEELTRRVRALPGVESAAVTSALPLTDYTQRGSVLFEGRPAPPPGQRPQFPISIVTPDYFRVMGIPIVAGRGFDRGDLAHSQEVAIVNEAFARRFYPGERATGKRIRLYGGPNFTTIAGVVADVRHKGREVAADPQLFVPEVQFPNPIVGLVVRTKNDPLALIPAVRAAVCSVDKDQPIYDVQTMQARISEAGGRRRAQTLSLSAFGALALCLAAVGIYGMVSQAVNQRTREFGIRMALGAEAGDVVRMVMKRSMALAVTGIAIGFGAMLYLVRFLQSLIFGVKITDAAAFIAAAGALLGAALAAAYLPARRAVRIRPAEALRCE